MAKNRIKSNRRARKPAQVSRYNQKTLMHDREYGFYWYAWLWKFFRPILVLLCSLVVVLGIVASGWNYVNEQFFMPVDPSDTQVREFVIESGSSITKIGENLYEQGLIRNKGIFKYIVQFRELTNSIQYGSYPLSPSMDVNQIISVLAAGSASNERTITIIPGWTVEDIAEYLLKQGAITSTDDFLKLCNQAETFENDSYALSQAMESGSFSNRKYALEGYLAPDTYRVYANASAESILRTLLHQFDLVIDKAFNSDPVFETTVDEAGNLLDDEGNIIDESDQVLFETTLSQDETLILASIIEKEAGRKADYDKVSAVFHNRLQRGMRLESDATVNYVLGQSRMALTSEDLSVESPYNTYLNDGLPIGPICNPSQAAIQAALYPDMDYIYDEYLYFCATDPSSSALAFSKTKEEHEAIVAQYRPLWEEFDQKNAAQSG